MKLMCSSGGGYFLFYSFHCWFALNRVSYLVFNSSDCHCKFHIQVYHLMSVDCFHSNIALFQF